MIADGITLSEIAKSLKIKKSHVSYYTAKARSLGYVKEVARDTFKILEVTQAGKNFLAMYHKSLEVPICRAENTRFKGPVYKMPTIPVDWGRVEMRNWTQYTNVIDDIKIKVNCGINPTIEFIPGPIDGDNPLAMFGSILLDCSEVAKRLEEIMDIKIGRLELSSKGEWIVYHPLAKNITANIGRVTVQGVGKINASLPERYGEFEFYDPRAAAEFLEMPRRLARLERNMNELSEQIRSKEPN
jgi:DNA-binding MarR family transcriptional regulator